jgi:xanthine dehydrogenase small subunit
MRNAIHTIVNGRPLTISHLPPETMALGWLRDHGLISVKEGCGEGDCGACTVALGTPSGDGLAWRAVNSCLLFLPMLDGRAVLTAEGLTGRDGAPHLVQAAMAEEFGTQCGFCSPGMTLSLFALSRHADRDDAAVLEALAGNLCRCTGYRPILDAARRLPPVIPPDPAEAEMATRLRELTAEPLDYTGDGRSLFAPHHLDQALAWRAAHPDAWVMAGGTDLGLAVTKRDQRPAAILLLSRVAELITVECGAEGGLAIGAALPYADLLAPLSESYPEFARLVRRIGATQVRNMGTIGGNLGNASPIGDTLPVLIALGAEVELASAGHRRRLPVEDFVTGYRRTVLRADELIVALHLPPPRPGEILRTAKVAKRFDQDISTVSAAFRLRLDDGRVTAIRAAFGGVADRPVRAKAVEAAVTGRPWSAETVAAAQRVLEEDIHPLSDFRGSAGYRRQVAANLVERLWRQTTGDAPASLEDL